LQNVASSGKGYLAVVAGIHRTYNFVVVAALLLFCHRRVEVSELRFGDYSVGVQVHPFKLLHELLEDELMLAHEMLLQQMDKSGVANRFAFLFGCWRERAAGIHACSVADLLQQ
jgi:hypothetical protein